jgi:hypothetical protein
MKEFGTITEAERGKTQIFGTKREELQSFNIVTVYIYIYIVRTFFTVSEYS